MIQPINDIVNIYYNRVIKNRDRVTDASGWVGERGG